jgi:hypothetical protein
MLAVKHLPGEVHFFSMTCTMQDEARMEGESPMSAVGNA